MKVTAGVVTIAEAGGLSINAESQTTLEVVTTGSFVEVRQGLDRAYQLTPSDAHRLAMELAKHASALG